MTADGMPVRSFDDFFRGINEKLSIALVLSTALNESRRRYASLPSDTATGSSWNAIFNCSKMCVGLAGGPFALRHRTLLFSKSGRYKLHIFNVQQNRVGSCTWAKYILKKNFPTLLSSSYLHPIHSISKSISSNSRVYNHFLMQGNPPFALALWPRVV